MSSLDKDLRVTGVDEGLSSNDKKDSPTTFNHLEDVIEAGSDIVYDEENEEPEFHMRTWVALGALWLLNYVQIIALQGPPALVSQLSITSRVPGPKLILALI